MLIWLHVLYHSTVATDNCTVRLRYISRRKRAPTAEPSYSFCFSPTSQALHATGPTKFSVFHVSFGRSSISPEPHYARYLDD